MKQERRSSAPDRQTHRTLMRLRTSSLIERAFGTENIAVTKEVAAAESALRAGDLTRAKSHTVRATIEHDIHERFQIIFGKDYDKR